MCLTPAVELFYFTLGLMATIIINSCEGDGLFYNPILDTPSAEQYIYLHTYGFYYMPRSNATGLYLYKSELLSDWRHAESKIVQTRFGKERMHNQPEIHFLKGNWYIYYHAYETTTAVTQFHVFVLKSLNPDSPFGKYGNEIRLTPAAPDDGNDGADGTVFKINGGGLYLIYSGRVTSNSATRKLFIAPMGNPTKIKGPRTIIRDTKFTWDTDIYSPQILREKTNGNQTFLVFTGISEGRNCIGLMGIGDGKNPLVADNWWHYPNGTVFASNPATDVYNPTGASFTYSPDLMESWMTYFANTRDSKSSTTRLDKIEWNKDGTPRFPIPTALTTPLPVPSGERSVSDCYIRDCASCLAVGCKAVMLTNSTMACVPYLAGHEIVELYSKCPSSASKGYWYWYGGIGILIGLLLAGIGYFVLKPLYLKSEFKQRRDSASEHLVIELRENQNQNQKSEAAPIMQRPTGAEDTSARATYGTN